MIKGDPDRLFMPIPLAGEAVLPVEDAVVRRINDDSILCEAELLQTPPHGAYGGVNSADEPVIAFHGSLINVRSREAHAPSAPVFGMLYGERETPDIVGTRPCGNGYGDALIE